MRRQKNRRASRAQGRGVARQINIPLPLQGLFVEAKTAEFSGLYASELNNIKSNGVSLEVVKSYSYGDLSETALRRIPFEFGAYSQYINIRTERIDSGIASFERSIAPTAAYGYISSQAVIVDGLGPPLTFNGMEFTEQTFTTTTDFDPTTFDGVLIHHDRPFFWKYDGELEFYYGDVGAVSGELTRFPLGRLGNITGTIRGMVSLTVDAAENLNDSLCIMTSTGDIVIYEGLDPGDAEDWRLSARVKAAPPLAREGFVKVGGDVWMITPSGLVSIIDSIQQGVLALVGNVSRPVAKKIREYVQDAGSDWQLHVSADAELIILNRYLNGSATQFIYHPENRVWETASYPAKRWHNLGLKTRFTAPDGTSAMLGVADDDSQPVTAVWETGWFNLNRASELKWVRPTIIAKGPLSVCLTVLSDHEATASDVAAAEQAVTVVPDTPGVDDENVALNDLFGVDAVGETFQIRMEITSTWAEIVSMQAGVL